MDNACMQVEGCNSGLGTSKGGAMSISREGSQERNFVMQSDTKPIIKCFITCNTDVRIMGAST